MVNLPILDTRTVGILFAFNAMAIAMAIFFSASTYPKAISRSMMTFGAGKILLATAFILVAARGILPISLTVVAANVLGGAGAYTNYMAVRLIFGKNPHVGGMVLTCTVVALGAVYFTFYANDLRGMRVITSLTLAVVMFVIADELLRKCHHTGRARLVGGWLGVFVGCVTLLRAYFTVDLAPISPNSYVGTGPEQLFLIINFCGATIGAVNMVLLSNDLFNEVLVQLARTDDLTGIANRRRLVERGVEEWHRSRRFAVPMAVLVIDLDHFKRINDTYGHATGDDVLQAAAQCFADEIRDVDFIGRVGGEEFVVILAGADSATAHGIAERLRRTMESLCVYCPANQPLSVTISLGAAVLSGDDSFEALWERADQALYEAKNAGRNRVALAAA